MVRAARLGLLPLLLAFGVAAAASAQTDPLADVDMYSLFASDKLLASTLHLVDGNIGVNRGPLLCSGTLDASDSVVIANRVALAPRNSSCDTLIANHVKGNASDCSVTDGFTAPLVASVPAACGFPAPFPACDPSESFTIRRGETRMLPPGVYGSVGSRRKPASGTLVLSGRGRYVFCDLVMSRKGTLLITDPAEIDVAGDAGLGLTQFTGTAGPLLDPNGVHIQGVPTELRFFVQGRSVKVDAAVSLQHLCAPAATLVVGHGGTLEGSFVARAIDVRHVAGPVAISADSRCGDGNVDAGEDCDDGNNVDGDGCESDCTAPACGNGVLDPGEQCDDGNNDDGDGCEGDCTLPVCGNGIVDAGEACDDGNTVDGDGCEHDCKVTPACGNGVLDPGEQCDDGNNDDGDGCEGDCTLPTCGNGILDPGEECDDGNKVDGDGCEANCRLPVCGNGILDDGEECDDGNQKNGDACENDCTLPVCGNGIKDVGEECDDGNDVDGDGCESDCTVTPGAPVCGNGIVEGDEECDDGNQRDGDGCESDCTLPFCGNGIVDRGEQCDPGLDDTCEPDCTLPFCGNGVVDDGEECDDGNRQNGDDCENDCTLPVCGNGIVDDGEECDDGNDVAGDGCESDCTITPPPDFVRDIGSAQAKAAGTRATVSVPDEPVPVGDTVVVTVAMTNVAGTVTCGDTKGNVYTVDAQASNPDAGSGGTRTIICSAYVTHELENAVTTSPMHTTPADSVFVNYPTAKGVAMTVYEFENLSPHPLHETLAAADSSPGPKPPLFFTTTAQNALVITATATATTVVGTFTPGDGWTALTDTSTTGSGRNSAIMPEYRITPGGDTPIAWKYGSSHAWAAATAALR